MSDNGKELTVTLRLTVRVKAKLECKELNLKPDWGGNDSQRRGV